MRRTLRVVLVATAALLSVSALTYSWAAFVTSKAVGELPDDLSPPSVALVSALQCVHGDSLARLAARQVLGPHRTRPLLWHPKFALFTFAAGHRRDWEVAGLAAEYLRPRLVPSSLYFELDGKSALDAVVAERYRHPDSEAAREARHRCSPSAAQHL